MISTAGESIKSSSFGAVVFGILNPQLLQFLVSLMFEGDSGIRFARWLYAPGNLSEIRQLAGNDPELQDELLAQQRLIHEQQRNLDAVLGDFVTS